MFYSIQDLQDELNEYFLRVKFEKLRELKNYLKGVYVITYRDIPIYAGQSINIKSRLKTHKANGLFGDYYYLMIIEEQHIRTYVTTISIMRYETILNVKYGVRRRNGFKQLDLEYLYQYIENEFRNANRFERWRWVDKAHKSLIRMELEG